jgi:hypothetical protein
MEGAAQARLRAGHSGVGGLRRWWDVTLAGLRYADYLRFLRWVGGLQQKRLDLKSGYLGYDS